MPSEPKAKSLFLAALDKAPAERASYLQRKKSISRRNEIIELVEEFNQWLSFRAFPCWRGKRSNLGFS
jgi:hypothetical protein